VRLREALAGHHTRSSTLAESPAVAYNVLSLGVQGQLCGCCVPD
jgi:hypothetical protein